MWLDALSFGILLVFTLLGAWRGAYESALRLLALVLSYGIAIHAARVAGPRLAESLGVSTLVGAPLAGTAAFASCHVLFAIAIRLTRAAERRRLGEEPRGLTDRSGGAVLGVCRGLVIALLLGWLASFGQAIGNVAQAWPLPDTTESSVARLSGQVVGRGARQLLGDEDPGARLVSQLAGSPAETLQSMQDVLEHPSLENLQRDRVFWSLLESGSVGAALDRRSFRGLAGDAGLRSDLAGLGLVEAEAAGDPEVFRSELEPVLHQLGPRLRDLNTDPEVQQLLADPQIRHMAESGDVLGLIGHPTLMHLVRRVAAAPDGGTP